MNLANIFIIFIALLVILLNPFIYIIKENKDFSLKETNKMVLLALTPILLGLYIFVRYMIFLFSALLVHGVGETNSLYTVIANFSIPALDILYWFIASKLKVFAAQKQNIFKQVRFLFFELILLPPAALFFSTLLTMLILNYLN